MSRNISSKTIEGATINDDQDRVCIGIYIDVDPRKPKSLRLEYGDVVVRTTTVTGKEPTKEVLSVSYAGQLDASEAEMESLPCFPEVYPQLKALADAKSAQRWPDLA